MNIVYDKSLMKLNKNLDLLVYIEKLRQSEVLIQNAKVGIVKKNTKRDEENWVEVENDDDR